MLKPSWTQIAHDVCASSLHLLVEHGPSTRVLKLIAHVDARRSGRPRQSESVSLGRIDLL